MSEHSRTHKLQSHHGLHIASVTYLTTFSTSAFSTPAFSTSAFSTSAQVVVTGHSLGGAVGVMLTHLLKDAVPDVRAVVYGCPACLDAQTADCMKDRVLTVINHDDIICRITPQRLD